MRTGQSDVRVRAISGIVQQNRVLCQPKRQSKGQRRCPSCKFLVFNISRRCDQVLQTQARGRHENEKREPRQMVLMLWQSFFVCPELMDFPVVELITAVSMRAVWQSGYSKNLSIS